MNPQPVLGTISAGGSQEIAVKINTMGLAFDSTYHAALVIESNDPDEPNKSIPVHLTVNAPINISGTVDSAGVALEGVVVQAWDNYPDGTIVVSDTSDAEGRFTSYVWNEGIYDLRAFASGFFPVIAENVQAPASGINLSLEALPSVTPTNEWIDFYGSNTTFWYAPVQIGDVVVAKDPDGVFCGVFEINKSGNYGLMSVYRDDVTTTNVDEGANPGEVISFEINRNKAITLGPDSPVWTSNGAILNVDLAVFPETEVEIPMVAGWNLLSWNIDTPNDSSSVLLKEIMAKVIVVLGYEGGGLTYDPSLPQFSTLLTMEHLHGYWIRLTDGDTLRLTGIPVDRATTPIFCEAGWNLVSYLPNKPDSIAHAFSTVMDNLIVAIGFYEGGLTYYPTLPQFSTLQVLAPTFGYWLKLTEEDTIIYPEPLPGATSEPIGPLALTDGMGLDRMTPGDIIPTTEWLNIYGEGIKVDGELLSVATVVKAIDIEGRVCGRYVVKQPGKFGLMPIYRDDVTSEVDEGAMPGEEISIYFDDFELPTKINWTMMGDIIDLGKIIITSIGELSALPKEFALSQNYPNPFNPETVISYQLPKTAYTILKIYNTLGQEVKTLVNEQKESGYHKVVWDGKDNLGNQVTSGVYFYRIKADKFQHTIKMIFLY